MRSLSRHSPAAYIASLSSGFGASSQHHLTQLAVDSLVTSSEAVCMEDVLASTILQKVVSNKVDNYLFNLLVENSLPADRAHLLSVSSHHAASCRV